VTLVTSIFGKGCPQFAGVEAPKTPEMDKPGAWTLEGEPLSMGAFTPKLEGV